MTFRRHLLITALLVTFTVMLSGQALAAGTPTYSSSFGSAGTGNGQFSDPYGVAVDPEGNVWVSDRTANRVQKFNSKGEYVCKIGSTGTGNGQFKAPHGLAADSAGNVWVADTENNRLEKIGPSCEYLSQMGKLGEGNGQFAEPFGVTVDPSGNIWVADTGNARVQKFNAKGEFLTKCGSWGPGPGQFWEPFAIAADADGNVWVGEEERLSQLSASCEFLGQFTRSSLKTETELFPFGMAVDPSGNIWLSNRVSVSGYYPEGEYVTKFGSEGTGAGQFNRAVGVAAASDGSLWVVDNHNARVEKWAPGTPSAVETGRAAQIKRTEVSLMGKVNPEGIATSYQFEYGATTSFGSVVPASPKAIGSGSSPVAVSEHLDGLKAGQTYYYRVTATSEKGTTHGGTRHFTTLAAAGKGAQVRIGGKTFAELGIKEAPVALQGSFKIVFSPSTWPYYTCSENGTGTLVSSGVSSESVTLTCSIIGAGEGCKVEPIEFKVNGSFESVGLLTTIITRTCPAFFEEFELASPKGSFEFGSEAVGINVNSSATTWFGSHEVTLTGDSHWSLLGEKSGKAIGFW